MQEILIISKTIFQIALTLSCSLICSLINTNFAFANLTSCWPCHKENVVAIPSQICASFVIPCVVYQTCCW